MFQKHQRQEDDELNLSGEPPHIGGFGDDEPDDDQASFTPDASAPVSDRASRAAAERAKKRKQEKEAAQKRSAKAKEANKNPYRTRSAASIRAEREARRAPRSITSMGDEGAPRRSAKVELDHAKIQEILRNPTRVVTEEDLRKEYAYVVNDLRMTGVLAGGLIVVLIILAQVLPK